MISLTQTCSSLRSWWDEALTHLKHLSLPLLGPGLKPEYSLNLENRINPRLHITQIPKRVSLDSLESCQSVFLQRGEPVLDCLSLSCLFFYHFVSYVSFFVNTYKNKTRTGQTIHSLPRDMADVCKMTKLIPLCLLDRFDRRENWSNEAYLHLTASTSSSFKRYNKIRLGTVCTCIWLLDCWQ